MTESAIPASVNCSDFSLALAEPQFGNFKPATTWLLLEYDGRWEQEALADSALPAQVKDHMQTFLSTHPLARALLIRQKPRLVTGGPLFFVAQTTAPYRLYTFALDRYEDLLDLNLSAIAAGDPRFDGALRADPLLLVCTHGRRDRCCARHGLAVYESLAALAGEVAWQSSHVGGHRFAANVLVFPQGVVYGRVSPDTAAAIYRATLAGELVLEYYRARVAYPPPAQAADYYVRLRTGQTALAAFDLRTVEQHTGGEWMVTFNAAEGDEQRVVIVREQAGPQTLVNCGDTQLSPSMQYVLVSISKRRGDLSESAPQ